MNIEELNGRPLRLLIGGSPCFEAGTQILTKEGLKNIEEIEVGDLVYTHKNRYMPVIDIGNKESEVYDLKAQGIYSTHVTLNHPYYTRNVKRYFPTVNGKRKNWRKLLEAKWEIVEILHDKSYLASPIIEQTENPYNLTKEQCWILGRYVADGHIRYSKRAQRKNSYQYGVILSIGSHKLEYVKKKISTYHYSCYPHTKSTHRVVISNQNLVEFIINNDFGMGAENKNIPGIILNLPIEFAKEFLDGYMSGDGCYIDNYKIYTATTISKRLAFSLALLVQKILNVNTSITYNTPQPKRIIEGREVNQKPQYIITYRDKTRKQTHAIVDNKDKKIWVPYKDKKYVGKTIVYNLSVLEDESYIANNLVVHNCTHWSIAQKNNRETKPEGLGWELFENYLIAKEKFNPDFFLYENNKSMSNDIRQQIDYEFMSYYLNNDEWEMIND
ncbi:MAG: Hint domain-containing protein [Clostridium sp.]|nr:Hint domain-containing protein [Clostridium sp.]